MVDESASTGDSVAGKSVNSTILEPAVYDVSSRSFSNRWAAMDLADWTGSGPLRPDRYLDFWTFGRIEPIEAGQGHRYFLLGEATRQRLFSSMRLLASITRRPATLSGEGWGTS